MGGLEDGAGGLLPQHVAPGLGGGGGPEAVGGVGLAVAELREAQRRRRRGEPRDVRGRVAQQRRLVQRQGRVHGPQQLRGQRRHRGRIAGGGDRGSRRRVVVLVCFLSSIFSPYLGEAW